MASSSDDPSDYSRYNPEITEILAVFRREKELEKQQSALCNLLIHRGVEVASLSKEQNDPAMQTALKICGEEFLKLEQTLENKSRYAGLHQLLRHEAWRKLQQDPS
ncbi:MAG: hypothetical protein Q9168_005983 [Polycauliona sp. 1 TL-2023]